MPRGMISIVIPVKDGGDDLRRLLDAIARQDLDEEVEVVVVDSGSTDGSRELALQHGARVHEIAPEEFNHGATRNLGAKLAEGEIVVFTVDDALPMGDRWLPELVEPLHSEPDLAATYSRQIPGEDAPPGQRTYIEFRYGPEPRIQRASDPAELTPSLTLFSNVSSAVRRDVIDANPFRTDLITAEDLEWCGRVLLNGHAIAYVPESVVRHSHRFTLVNWFQRYFDQGMASQSTLYRPGPSATRSVRAAGLSYLRHEMRSLWSSGQRRDIPRTLAFEVARYAGFRLGANSRLVPRRLRPRLSNTPAYWQASKRSAS